MLGQWVVRRSGLLLLIAGCGTPKSAESSAPLLPYCSRDEVEKNACGQLRRSILIEPDGKRVPLEQVLCEVSTPQARMLWSREDKPEFRYYAKVSFQIKENRGTMVPQSIVPIIEQWPCAGQMCEAMRELPESTRIAIPKLKHCYDSPAPDPNEVILSLPSLDAETCVDSWLLPSCPTPNDEAEHYGVTVYHPFFGFELLVMHVRNDEVTTYLNGKKRGNLPTVNVDSLLQKLRATWDFTKPSRSSSCRDGDSTLIEARKPGAWRRIELHCTDELGITQAIRQLAQ